MSHTETSKRIPSHLRQKGWMGGFSLLELSIVITIIATLTGLGIQTGSNMVEASRLAQTNTKIEQIKRAVYAFRVSNSRIPCPASLTLALTSANFGVEGPNTAGCINATAGAATATNTDANGETAEGAVPTKTLGLPDDFAFDGWGNRFRYATTIFYVSTNAFTNSALDDSCGAAKVLDGTGASNFRTQEAVYTLVSHGANGHGAYTRSGAIKNAGSTNTYEQNNCSCNSGAAATTYTATYAQRDIYQNPASSTDTFDDIVEYQMRWQMDAYQQSTKASSAPYAVVSQINGAASSRVRSFNLVGNQLVANPDSSTSPMPTTADSTPVYSPDDKYVVMGTCTWPWDKAALVYKTGCRRLSKNGISVTSPVSHCAYYNSISRDGKYLGLAGSDRAQVMHGTNYTTYLGTILIGTTQAIGPIAFSPTEDFVVVGDSSASGGNVFLKSFTYNTATNVFTAGPVTSIPDSSGGLYTIDQIVFSKNGKYIAVGLRYQAGIRLYKSTGGGTLTPIAITPMGNMVSWQSSAGFSPDGSLLIISSYYRLYVYTIDAATDTFTYNNDFDSVTWGTPSFSPDSQYLTINSGVLFKRNSTTGPTFTRITAPAPFVPSPTGTAMTTVFRNNQ